MRRIELIISSTGVQYTNSSRVTMVVKLLYKLFFSFDLFILKNLFWSLAIFSELIKLNNYFFYRSKNTLKEEILLSDSTMKPFIKASDNYLKSDKSKEMKVLTNGVSEKLLEQK